jgi:lipopolysaccharide export system permease protein
MRLIDRYLLRQLLGPVVLATAALSALALFSQSLSALDLLISQRQSALVFAKITLLAMPQLINIVLPIALFVSALVALNRLHTEQEIVVCFAGGMSRWRVIAPAMRLAATLAFAALLMNLFIQPAAYRAMRGELFKVRTDLAATLVREGEFTTPTPGLTVYAQSVGGDGVMHNLFIHESKTDGSASTYAADEGRIGRSRGQPVLVLRNGSVQQLSEAGVLNYLAFKEYVYDVSALADTGQMIHYKPSDRYPHELFFPDLKQDWEQRNRLGLLAEGHARIASPLYNITVMAIALAAILGGGFSRLGYGGRIAVASAVVVIIRIAGFVAQAVADDAAMLNGLQYAIPIGAAAVALMSVFRNPNRGRRASPRNRRALRQAAA